MSPGVVLAMLERPMPKELAVNAEWKPVAIGFPAFQSSMHPSHISSASHPDCVAAGSDRGAWQPRHRDVTGPALEPRHRFSAISSATGLSRTERWQPKHLSSSHVACGMVVVCVCVCVCCVAAFVGCAFNLASVQAERRLDGVSLVATAV